MEYILIFENTHMALKCENILNNKQININILPSPSYITNSCGICIGFSEKDLTYILELSRKNEIEFKELYDLSNNEKIDINKFDFNI